MFWRLTECARGDGPIDPDRCTASNRPQAKSDERNATVDSQLLGVTQASQVSLFVGTGAGASYVMGGSPAESCQPANSAQSICSDLPIISL
jgi:hypothetical protein